MLTPRQAAFAYGAFVVYATTQPWHFDLSPEQLGMALRGIEGSERFALAAGVRVVPDLLLNTLLFAPLGVALALAGRPPGVAVALGAGLSLLVEALQLGLPARATSPWDLLANTAGCMAGATLGARLWPKLRACLDRWMAHGPLVIPTLLVFGALAVRYLEPFYFGFDGALLAQRITTLLRFNLGLRGLADVGVIALEWGCAAALLSAFTRPPVLAALWVSLFATLLQLARLFLIYRVSFSGELIVAIAAATAGALFGRQLRQRPRLLLGGLFALHALLAGWRPLRLASAAQIDAQLSLDRLVPLYIGYAEPGLGWVATWLDLGLRYALLGWLLAGRLSRNQATCVAAALATIVAGGQIIFAGHTPGITDLCVASAATWLAVSAAQFGNFVFTNAVQDAVESKK